MGMGRADPQSSKSLRAIASRLRTIAANLDDIAKRMDEAGVECLVVMHSTGVMGERRTAALKKLEDFSRDAERKLRDARE